MSESHTYRLSDTAISQVAKLLQIAMLTGTDIVDNLRMLELEVVDDTLEPSAEFLERLDENVSNMMKELEENGAFEETPAEDG